MRAMDGRLLLGRCAALGLCLLLARGVAAEDGDFKELRRRYETWQERPSLYLRHRGRVEFAETGDVRALEILAKSYAKPEVPKDQVRYLLASMCADHFRAPAHLDTLRAWRRKHARTEDAWLWYRVLGTEHHIEGPAELVDVVRRQRDGVLRAAALEALVAAKDPAVLPMAGEVMATLPTRILDRAVLLGSCAEALVETRAERTTEAWRTLADGLAGALDDRTLPETTAMAIRRRLAVALDTPELHATAKAWRAVLAGPAPAPPTDERPPTDETKDRYAPPKRPTFLGLEASGVRVIYVIDMSDSMLTPLTGKEVEDLKKTPVRRAPAPPPVVTGDKPGAKKGPRPPAVAPPEPDPRVARLPWNLIRTRFDAAREFLKLSLRGLGPDQSFCVIGFGSEATLFEATPTLRPAKENWVEKTCVELDTIEPGPQTKSRPYGTLRGYTNIHGGLHRAFKLRAKGLVKESEYVDLATFTEGCDTIFLFSDGKPTWDDWPEWDLRLPEHASGDPESGVEVKDHEKGHYYGPYALASVLRDDVRRLNLFRKVEIHCVGIGEYDPHLLQWISQAGRGAFRRIPGD